MHSLQNPGTTHAEIFRGASSSTADSQRWSPEILTSQSRPTAMPSLSASLMAYAEVHRTNKNGNVASIAILLFDYFDTFDREVELIWKAKWNFGKVIFLLVRYPVLAGFVFQLYGTLGFNVPIESCPFVINTAALFLFAGICAGQVILILRTYALWERSRKLLTCLSVVYFIEVVAIAITLVAYKRSCHFHHLPSPLFTGCHSLCGNSLITVDFGLVMAMESTILLFTLWIGFRKYEISRSPNRLVSVLFRDGVLCYICICTLALGNILVYTLAPEGLCSFMGSLQRITHSIIPTRIVLHVRETGAFPEAPVNLSDFDMHLSLEAPPLKSRVTVDLPPFQTMMNLNA